jgi:hypothetical protein
MDAPVAPRKRRGRGNRRPNAKDREAEQRWAQRQADCVRLVTAGWTFRDVAESLGYADGSNAHRDYLKAIRASPALAVKEHRQKIVDRVNLVVRGSMTKARAGSATHADMILRASALEARLVGAFAPEQLEHLGLEVVTPEDVMDRIDKIAKDIGGLVTPAGAVVVASTTPDTGEDDDGDA